MEWYYINPAQQQIGPLSDSEIQDLIGNRTVKTTTMVWNDSMSGWLPVEQTPLSTFCLKAVLPPIPPMTSPPSSIKKNEPLAIWSLILGIISIVGCGILTGIPAVLCGHLSLSRIKKTPSLGGRGKALTGLILGYFGLLIVAVVAVLALFGKPGITAARETSAVAARISNMRSAHLVFHTASLDAVSAADNTIGWPSDAQLKTMADVKRMLVPRYLSEREFDQLEIAKYTIGNVSIDDPGDTIVLKYEPSDVGSTIIYLKNGQVGVIPSPAVLRPQIEDWETRIRPDDYKILQPGQTFGNPPPRTPMFLE